VIFGSKAVGEPPLMLAFCVREALRDAVAAFGQRRRSWNWRRRPRRKRSSARSARSRRAARA
jgi:xanthine dehydrogenase molybdopterin-binding subunit B